jgi:hypothetical protein
MAKAKMKQGAIPKFSSEAEEAAWWDAHCSEIKAEIRRRLKQKRPLTLSNLLQGATYHAADPEGGSGNGAPIGGAKRSGIPDLYQDAPQGGPRGEYE